MCTGNFHGYFYWSDEVHMYVYVHVHVQQLPGGCIVLKIALLHSFTVLKIVMLIYF